MVVPFNADRHDHIAYILEYDGSALPEELAACLRAVAFKEVTTPPAEVHFSCVVRACLKLSDKAHPLLAVITTRRLVALQPSRFPTDLAENVTPAPGVLLRPFLAGRVVVRRTHPLDTSAISWAGANHLAVGWRIDNSEVIDPGAEDRICAAIRLPLRTYAGIVLAHEDEVKRLCASTTDLTEELHIAAAGSTGRPQEAVIGRRQASKLRFRGRPLCRGAIKNKKIDFSHGFFHTLFRPQDSRHPRRSELQGIEVFIRSRAAMSTLVENSESEIRSVTRDFEGPYAKTWDGSRHAAGNKEDDMMRNTTGQLP